MPRKIFKRYIPKPEHVQSNPKLRFLGPLLEDPNLFHLNRYSVSMAFLIGVFLAFFPLPGQMALAALIAFWVRCNLPITVALVWITNPITITPIFFATYKLGSWLLDTPPMILDSVSWETLHSEIIKIWKPLLVGSLCAGSFFSLFSYFTVSFCWRLYVIYQWNHRKQRRLRAQQKKLAKSAKKTN
jgi:uncharacterized protein (DUF2062 family)